MQVLQSEEDLTNVKPGTRRSYDRISGLPRVWGYGFRVGPYFRHEPQTLSNSQETLDPKLHPAPDGSKPRNILMSARLLGVGVVVEGSVPRQFWDSRKGSWKVPYFFTSLGTRDGPLQCATLAQITLARITLDSRTKYSDEEFPVALIVYAIMCVH